MFSFISNVFPIERTDSSDESSQQTTLLFIGDHLNCKSSLLFQLIQSLLLKSKEDIHYIIGQNLTEMPKPVHRMTRIGLGNGRLLHFLKVYYLTTYDSLVNHLLGLQSSDMCPTAIIIDNVGHYAKELSENSEKIARNGEQQAKNKRHKISRKGDKQLFAELSALLISTGNCCQRKLGKSTTIVMGYDLNDGSDTEWANIGPIGRRFYDYVWSLRTTFTDEESANFLLKSQSNECRLRLDLSLEDNEFVLNSIGLKK